MAEAPYAGLPYTNMDNKREPTSKYHLDADGLLEDFEALADGTAIQDEKVTTRMLSPELLTLISYGIQSAVDTWSDLPDPDTLDPGVTYAVRETETVDLIEYLAGVYRVIDGTPNTWEFMFSILDRFISMADTPEAYAGSALYVVRVNAAENGLEFVPWSGNKPYTAEFQAGTVIVPATAGATYEEITLTNGIQPSHAFDPDTPERWEDEFRVPSDPDTAGTVTFELWGLVKTAETDKDVVFDFWHSARATDEDVDHEYINKTSGALRCSNTNKILKRFTWTETFANLGWAANDKVRIKLERDADAAADTLETDFNWTSFAVIIPRA